MSYKKLQWDIDAWVDYIYCGLGKPEALKDNLKGLWSRRIDEKNRIVYIIEEDAIIIVSCRNHYDF